MHTTTTYAHTYAHAVALALALAPPPRALCAAEEGAADFDAAANPANAAESAEAALARRRSEYVHGPRPHPLTDMAPSMEGVAVTYTLPAVDKLVFPAGEPVSVLAGVHNGGAHAINVSMAIASLNAAYDFSLHVQNFSAALYGTGVYTRAHALARTRPGARTTRALAHTDARARVQPLRSGRRRASRTRLSLRHPSARRSSLRP